MALLLNIGGYLLEALLFLAQQLRDHPAGPGLIEKGKLYIL